MKKIPTLFERQFENHKIVGITDKVTEGMDWVLDGEGVATVKMDGSCCAIIGGYFYKRFDAKKGRKVPEGAIPCCEPDPITGHHPHWVEINPFSPADQWFSYAHMKSFAAGALLKGDCTYEAIGRHFNGNPYGMSDDCLVPHGKMIVEVERTFEGIRKYLEENYIEGIVFWKDGEPQCKIKRSDFGFEWGGK